MADTFRVLMKDSYPSQERMSILIIEEVGLVIVMDADEILRSAGQSSRHPLLPALDHGSRTVIVCRQHSDRVVRP
jgi:hypothetical protein